MGALETVDQDDFMKLIDSTQALKCKCYPDEIIKKSKAQFCARSNKQLKVNDFFEIYEPVVHQTKVLFMFILEVLMGLMFNQGDVTAKFLHVDIRENQNVYVEMPRGFEHFSKNGRKKYLKLKKTLYGLSKSPRAFLQYLINNLEQIGLKQSKFDPFFFQVRKSHVLYRSTILYFGLGKKTTSITWK